jgi:hypothetical protein
MSEKDEAQPVKPKYVWRRIDPRNRIAIIKHFFHMFGDMVKYGTPRDMVDPQVLEKAKGTIFDANMVAIPAETCKYIADHLDFQDEQCRLLRARIAELEKQ